LIINCLKKEKRESERERPLVLLSLFSFFAHPVCKATLILTAQKSGVRILIALLLVRFLSLFLFDAPQAEIGVAAGFGWQHRTRLGLLYMVFLGRGSKGMERRLA